MKQSDSIKHVVDRLFDLLQDVPVSIAVKALAIVTAEFVRAQQREDDEHEQLGRNQ